MERMPNLSADLPDHLLGDLPEELWQYVNEDSDEVEGEDTPLLPVAKKRRGAAQAWTTMQTFRNVADFRKWMSEAADSHNWVKANKQATSSGEKQYYKCSFARRKGYQPCPRKLCALFAQDSETIELSCNNQEHWHSKLGGEGAASAKFKVQPKAKELVVDALKNGQKPMDIRKSLRSNGFEVPTKQQMWNSVAYLRRTHEDLARVFTTSDLRSWIEEHKATPVAPNAAYVAGSYVCVAESGEDYRFGVVISTPNLIVELSKEGRQKCLHLDATYKLLWNGSPVFVVAISDVDHHIFPVCIYVCNTEDSSAYEFVLRTLKD